MEKTPMRNISLSCLALTLCLSSPLQAASSKEEIRGLLKSIFEDNVKHVSNISQEQFKSFAEQQAPRATVVSCSDSRVQINAFHKSPANDLFVIRNIGNQIKTAEGSIEYGVNHLHTPVMFIIGHSGCGAVHTALGNYSQESKAIRVELDHLHLSPKITTDEGVIENVNNQVAYALNKFKDKISKNELVVVGTVYDFRDDFHLGHGKLILINLNGEKDPKKIKESDYIKDLDNLAIGLKK
jgi:carbonic anhydrase